MTAPTTIEQAADHYELLVKDTRRFTGIGKLGQFVVVQTERCEACIDKSYSSFIRAEDHLTSWKHTALRYMIEPLDLRREVYERTRQWIIENETWMLPKYEAAAGPKKEGNE